MHADNLKVTSKIMELECMASKPVEEKKKGNKHSNRRQEKGDKESKGKA